MLELKHISKTYKTSKGVETRALQDINVVFPKRGMVFVLGKSGSGKSTLLNVVGGLDQASDGEIIIHQKSSKDFSQADYDSYRNTYVGFIFQEFNLMDDYTIEKNIALALQLQQVEVKPEVIDSLLTRLGLEGYGQRYPNELSGGQKQRVAIARALVKNPQILMADEPTGALDSITGKEIFETLKELSKEKLVIVVSHDRDSAQQYADRIIEFKDGVIDSDTNPDVVVEQDEFHAIKSHLPFKDSFKLGFSCLAHKKIRMVFTILLTSFALITLGISDAVGDFNGANAQHKAMNEMKEELVGIQRQYVDEEGNILENYNQQYLNLSDTEAADIINNTNMNFAHVYGSQSIKISDASLGIDVITPSLYHQSLNGYYITEMSDFLILSLEDITGKFPSNFEEVAISSYLVDSILLNGVKNEEGKTLYPKSVDEIIGKIKLHVENKWLTISGVVNIDLDKYDALKEKNIEQLTKEERKLLDEFRKIVEMNCNKLYTKTGFVESLKLEKETSMRAINGSFNVGDGTTYANISEIGYLQDELTYFNGTEMVKSTGLKDDEIILDLSSIAQLTSMNAHASIYSEEFEKKSEEEKKAFILNGLQKVIGKSYTLEYREHYNTSEKAIDQKVRIIGTILPENDDYTADAIMNSSISYISKSLLEPYILQPLYLGELLTSSTGSERLELLENYSNKDELSAHTFVSLEVNTIQSFADFATQVFLYASVLFFVFAAVLMMNFIIVSIAYRKKDIGILRAIGARSSDVLKIFIWEGVTLALISYVVSMIGLQAISMLVNDFAKDTMNLSISLLIVTLRQPLVVLIMVAVVTLLACLIPVARIARQKPIDAIKK